MNNDLNTLIFFIQIDKNGYVTKYTKDQYYNDTNWYEIIVDAAYLDDFKKHYYNYKYDTKLRTLIYPGDSFITPNTSQGSGGNVTNGQLDRITTQDQNYTDQASKKAVSSANNYTDDKVAGIHFSGVTQSDLNTAKTSAVNYAYQGDIQTKSLATSYTDKKVAGIHVSGGVAKGYVDNAVSNATNQANDIGKNVLNQANTTANSAANSAISKANKYTDAKIVEAANRDDAINKSKQSPNTVFTWRVEANPNKPQPAAKGTLHVTWSAHNQQAHPKYTNDYQLAPGTYKWKDMGISQPNGTDYTQRMGWTNPGSVDPNNIVIKSNQTVTLNVLFM